MEHKLKAWVVFPGGTKFGEGRAELLQLVESEGSLNKAVKRMGMSYRAAWGYLRELEQASGLTLVESDVAGTRLTPEGRAFLAAYEAFRARVDRCAEEAFEEAFAEALRAARAPSRRTAQ